MRYGLPSAAGLLLLTGLAAAGLPAPLANAQDASKADTSTAAATPSASPASAASPKKASSTAGTTAASHDSQGKHYFVEFRARNAASYGHMYVMYGVANDRHEIIKSEIAGFFPAGDKQDCLNCSVYNWTIGHVVPVPSVIGASDGDLEEQYVLARFRVWIDAAQYQRLVAYIKERKAHIGPWHALLNNCVTFGRDVAVFLNLKVPFFIAVAPSIMMYPKDLVEDLREANGVHEDQGPLKDAPGSLPVMVGSEATAAKTSRTHSDPKKPVAGPSDGGKVASSTIH
jgi:hypothetical protein